jgi:hypothetical protein
MARQDRADLFGTSEGLMDFHARAARISEDGIDAFTFEAGHEDLAAAHCRPEFRPF